MPSSAPRKARPPAVTAVRLRRVRELAPVAVSVRSSLAVSLRMRPTLMARTPRARAMPKTVAQFTISADVGSSFFDSMLRSAAAASELALVSWAWVIGLLARIIQPSRLFWLARCSRRSALSVITVFGADVPMGSWLSSWTTGWARHWLGVHWLLLFPPRRGPGSRRRPFRRRRR